MASTSYIEVIKAALKVNVNFIKSILENETIISAVVKGNAYGHGASIVVPALEELGINHFSVYSSPEAKDVLPICGKNSSIMIMGYTCQDDFNWIIDNEIEFFVSEIQLLNKTLQIAKGLNKKAIIHLDIETGMNRTGLSLKRLKETIDFLNRNKKHFIIKGVTSHFAGAESIANYTRVRKQFSVFRKRIKLLNENGIYPEIKHIASSAAVINYPDTRLDLVRIGILLYGYWPTKETFIQYIHRRKDKTDPIKRALKWKSRVVSIKSIPEGEFIGYGLSFQAQHKMKIIILPVGYCNGYSRSLSNNGHVIVHGQIAPVIGSVNMNMLICDITGLSGINIGAEAILIGKQGDNEISFTSFAEMNNSLNYEILARLPQNIDRKLV
ncbi:MAG: alanine racemase [Bacteroidota bacterium]|nr:alanine racemase [Bacteroidota bacterium]